MRAHGGRGTLGVGFSGTQQITYWARGVSLQPLLPYPEGFDAGCRPAPECSVRRTNPSSVPVGNPGPGTWAVAWTAQYLQRQNAVSAEPHVLRSGAGTPAPGSLHIHTRAQPGVPCPGDPWSPRRDRRDSCRKDETVNPAEHLVFLFLSFPLLIVIFLLGLLIVERPKSLVIWCRRKSYLSLYLLTVPQNLHFLVDRQPGSCLT